MAGEIAHALLSTPADGGLGNARLARHPAAACQRAREPGMGRNTEACPFSVIAVRGQDSRPYDGNAAHGRPEGLLKDWLPGILTVPPFLLRQLYHPLWGDKNCRIGNPATSSPPSESRRAGRRAGDRSARLSPSRLRGPRNGVAPAGSAHDASQSLPDPQRADGHVAPHNQVAEEPMDADANGISRGFRGVANQPTVPAQVCRDDR